MLVQWPPRVIATGRVADEVRTQEKGIMVQGISSNFRPLSVEPQNFPNTSRRNAALPWLSLFAAGLLIAAPVSAADAAKAPAATMPTYIAPIPPTPDALTVPIQIDVGIFGGAALFSSKNRLGLAHDPTDVPGNSGEFGVRAGWVGMNRHLTVEGAVRDAFYTLRSGNATGQVLGFRVEGLWNFLPTARIQPFALVGIGDELLVSGKKQCPVGTAPTPDCIAMKSTHGILTSVLGAGLRIPITYRLAARVDAHWLLQQGRAKDDLAVPPIPATAVSSNWDLLAGLSWTFGGAPLDTDKDGIPDDLDKCPAEPEDKDGFEDSDGCPDPDNDKDGIPDAQDKCPNQPETRNGFQDEDGCPDVLDSDDDGIPDAKDKCPHEKEDKDGFEDYDGCPDPDNDQDGIPDKLDKCPNQPETKNGLNDDDGCPDSLPPAAQQLLDHPIDMKFRGSVLVPGGDNVFDPLLELLLEHEGVKMSISVAPEAGDDASQAEALARAESVRTAFGAKGIDASRIVCAVGSVVMPLPHEPEEQGKTKAGKHVKKPKKAKKGAAREPQLPTVARPVSLRIL